MKPSITPQTPYRPEYAEPDAAPPVAAGTTNPKRTWTQTLSVLIAGVALFSDGYNIQIAGYLNTIFAKLYPHDFNTGMKTRLSNSILIGDIFGMLIFGLCSDRLGRRFGIIGCTFFLVLGVTLATAAHGTTITGMFWMMVIARGIAGVGAGGEYAVCAISAIEAADETKNLRKRRGILVASSTNVAIIAGFVASSIVIVILLAAYKSVPTEAMWRIAFGIGIIMPLFIFIFRIRMIDSTLYQRHAVKGRKFPYKLAIRRYWRPLLGCCAVWFLYDVVVYPFNLLAPTIVQGFGSDQTLVQSNGWSALINAFSLPGAVFGGLLIDRLGARNTYIFGLCMVAIFGFTIGGAMEKLREPKAFPAFVVLFGLFQCFLQVGPGNCNFFVSSESFPTPVRGHFIGFAAAIGKVGAAVGTSMFPPIQASFSSVAKGQQVTFVIGAAICVVSALCAFVLIPPKGASLEDEDMLFRTWLEDNGWDTSTMGNGAVVAEQNVEDLEDGGEKKVAEDAGR